MNEGDLDGGGGRTRGRGHAGERAGKRDQNRPYAVTQGHTCLRSESRPLRRLVRWDVIAPACRQAQSLLGRSDGFTFLPLVWKVSIKTISKVWADSSVLKIQEPHERSCRPCVPLHYVDTLSRRKQKRSLSEQVNQQTAKALHDRACILTSTPRRREFRHINAFTDLTTYRLPPAGIVSILRRVSGALIFLLLPFFHLDVRHLALVRLFAVRRSKAAFNNGLGFVPGWFSSSSLSRARSGPTCTTSSPACATPLDGREPRAATARDGQSSAIFTLAASVLLTIVLGAKLFGLY